MTEMTKIKETKMTKIKETKMTKIKMAKMHKTTLEIPEKAWRQFKIVAGEKGLSRPQAIRGYIYDFIGVEGDNRYLPPSSYLGDPKKDSLGRSLCIFCGKPIPEDFWFDRWCFECLCKL